MSETTIQTMDVKEQLRALYGGENRRITGDDYDRTLAVRCVNGTFVGRRTENIVMYRGIPFVGQQPVGGLRWKTPVDVVPDDGVYEAYYNAESAYGNGQLETGSLYYHNEDCLYLNIWKSDEAAAEYLIRGAPAPLFCAFSRPSPARLSSILLSSLLRRPVARQDCKIINFGGRSDRNGPCKVVSFSNPGHPNEREVLR